MVSVSLRGVGCFRVRRKAWTSKRFPSPCGVWVVSIRTDYSQWQKAVSVPLRGVGCFINIEYEARFAVFPSPCGVWVVSEMVLTVHRWFAFPSPCGAWVVSTCRCATGRRLGVSVPLRGVGCFLLPLSRCLQSRLFPSPCGVWVVSTQLHMLSAVTRFPSPCGVWVVSPAARLSQPAAVVSVPLRGVGCFGKAAHSFWCNRKKNCQLCYFIVSYWQMFINSKLRNCKVPCEAHKTAT